MAHIYAWTGIVTHALLALPVKAMEPIPSGWWEIRSLNRRGWSTPRSPVQSGGQISPVMRAIRLSNDLIWTARCTAAVGSGFAVTDRGREVWPECPQAGEIPCVGRC